MIVTRQMNSELEVVKWIVVLALASALILGLTSLSAAVEAKLLPKEPGLLPDGIALWADPMDEPPMVQPFFPENPPAEMPAPVARQAVAQLWQALEHQRAGRIEAAIELWPEIPLPRNRMVWREIALGVAQMQAGDLQQAADHLERARDLRPTNAVADYFMGVLRLEQAFNAPQWPSVEQEGRIRLVALTPQVASDARSMYELAAMMEFRNAIQHAPGIELGEELLPTTAVQNGPLVGDLLAALGSDNFVGQSHRLLAGMFLDRDNPAEAEQHLDAANAAGMTIGSGYVAAAREYVDDAQNGAALRALTKDVAQRYPWCWNMIEPAADRPMIWVW